MMNIKTFESQINFERMPDEIELFRAGVWHGIEFTTADIDEIVESFNEVGLTELQPYLKLGHNDEQELLEKEGLPAAGWVASLRRDGDVLLAKTKDTPEIIKKLVEKKAYKRVSVELYINYTSPTGKKYPKVLKAVALLGGETPEVTTLQDVLALYSKNAEKTINIQEDGQMTVDNNNINVAEELAKFTSQIEAMKGELSSQKEALDSQKAQLDEQQENFAKKEAELLTKENEINQKAEKFSKLESVLENVESVESLVEFINSTKAEADAAAKLKEQSTQIIKNAKKDARESFVNSMLDEGRLLPFQTEMAKVILEQAETVTEELSFTKSVESINLKEKMSLYETLKSFMKSFPENKVLEQDSLGNKIKNSDVAAQRKAAITEYRKEHPKVSFGKAQLAVKQARPDLFEEN